MCHHRIGEGIDGDNQIFIRNGSELITLSPKEIMRFEMLPGSTMFLNCCNTSQENHGTIIDDYSPALAFINAGASEVISTTLPVRESDAFRIGYRVHELLLTDTISQSLEDCLHQALSEALAGNLQYYVSEAVEMGFPDLGKQLRFQRDFGDSKCESWKSYVMWKV